MTGPPFFVVRDHAIFWPDFWTEMPTMTATFGVFDARSRFSELIDRAERGEEIIVTRHGRVVARIAPPDAAPRQARTPEEIAALFEQIRLNREAIRRTSGPVTQAEIKAWKQEGQR